VSVKTGEKVIVIVTCPSCQTRYRHPLEDPDPAQECRCSRCENVFLPGPAPRRYRVLESEPIGADDIALASTARVTPIVPDASVPRTETHAAGHQKATMTIGMDDPSLADQLVETAVNKTTGHDRPVLSYSVVAGEGGANGRTVDPPGDSPVKLPEMWLSLDGGDERIRLVPAVRQPGDEDEAPDGSDRSEAADVGEKPWAGEGLVAPDDATEEEVHETARGSNGIGAWMVAVALIAGFSAVGWYVVPALGDNRFTSDPEVTGPAGGAVGILLCWLWLRWNSHRH